MLLIDKKKGLWICLILISLFFSSGIHAQVTLGISPYTQNFDVLPTIPTGWTVRTGATAGSLGTIYPSTILRESWNNNTGDFRDIAAMEAPQTSGMGNPGQMAATDRAFGVRPTAGLGYTGLAFLLQIDNTIGKTNFSLSLKHMIADITTTRNATYTVQYSTVAAGTSWTTLGSYTINGATAVWGSTPGVYPFGSGLDNIANTVWIRVIASASTGAGNAATYGIDDVSLSWTATTTPSINITSPNPSAAGASITQGSNNDVLSRTDINITACSAVLNSASFTTSAGYVAADINNFKLWYQASSVFSGTGTLIGTIAAAGPGAQNFTGLAQALPIGAGYLFLTADIACSATVTDNFNVAAVGTGNFTFAVFSSYTAVPAPSPGGVQNIIAGSTTDPVASPVIVGNSQLTISWTNPICYDEIMIVATDDPAVTSVPTGDGTLYTANVDYNDGTNFANLNPNEFCVYKGGISPVIVTSLVNSTLYHFKIFTRFGSTWSSGVAVSGTPIGPIVYPYRSTTTGGLWNDYNSWQKFVAGSWVATAPGEFPNSVTADVQIQAGATIYLNVRGYATRDLTVDAGAKLYCNSFTGNRFLNIYGNLLCNGTIGNGAIADDICFNFGGSACHLYGTGTFSCNRMRKNTGTNNTTTLTIDINVNTYWNGTALSNNYTGAPNKFDVIINSVFTCNNNGSVAIDGNTGVAFGSSYGSITVNGTLMIPNILYLTTNNSTPYNCLFKIGATGIVNAATVSMAASTGTATNTLSIAAGGKLKITGSAAITPFSNTGNIYTLSAGSTVEYSYAGSQTVESALPYSNLTISGSGVKTVNGNVNVGNILTLTAGTYSMSALQTNIGSGGAVTGNGGDFAAAALGGTVNFAGNGSINGTTLLNFRNLNINSGTVTVTVNNCNALNLNLVGGIFSIGAANQFNMLSGGTVAATAGDFATGVNGGILNFPGTGTFTGSCNPYNVYASNGVDFGTGTVTIQNGGSFRINTGGFANNNGPFYATNSTLLYNTGAAFTAGTEWYAVFTSGRGIPYHVTLATTGTSVTFGSSTSPRTMLGDLSIGSATIFSLSTAAGGDLFIAGNWTRAASATFTNNARRVTFNGGLADQLLTVTGGGNQNFGYITINKAAGLKLIQAAAPNATGITLAGNPLSGSPAPTLSLINGDLDLNQQTFKFTSWNGNQNNIQIDGSGANLTRNIISTGGIGTFAVSNPVAVTHNLTISRASGNASLLVCGPTVTVTTTGTGPGGGGIDFGSGLTTINGTLQINSFGFITGNAPSYGNNSFLVYNSGGPFTRNVEWGSTTSNPAYPYHVTVQNNTVLTLNTPPPVAGNGFADRYTAGDLWIKAGSTVICGPAYANKLTVGGNIQMDGTLTLPTTIGGDLYVAGNWNRSSTGIFTPNDRAVFFNGSGKSTITANNGQLFPYLYLVKNALADSLQLIDSISITYEFGITTGTFDLAAKNATLMSNATTGTADFGKVGALGDVGYSGVGRFVVERFIPSGVGAGEHAKSWQLLAVPDNGGQTINDAWQEGHVLPTLGVNGYGTIITSAVAGAGFDIIGGAGPSMKTYDTTGAGSWVGVANTTPLPLFNKKGYFILVRGDRRVSTYNAPSDSTTLRSKGKLFVPGSNPPLSTVVGAGKFETIGNPYASAIDFLNITRPSGPALDSIFYVWDPLLGGTYGLGAFQTISSVTGYKPTPGGTANYSNLLPYTKIQSGQAFMVHATGAGGTISFTENTKISGSKMVYRPSFPSTGQRQIFRSELYTAAGNLADANIVAFADSYNNGYDATDGLKILNAGENFGILENDKTLVIDTRKPVVRTDSIHYELSHLHVQSYQFRFEPENMDRRLNAWLIDRFLGTSTPISMSDSSFVNFSINAEAASAASDRFVLVFGRKNPFVEQAAPIVKLEEGKAGLTDTKMTTGIVSVYPNPVSDKTIKLIFHNMPAGNYASQLVNNDGQVIFANNFTVTGNDFNVSLRVAKASAGYYRLEITAENGNKTVLPVLVK